MQETEQLVEMSIVNPIREVVSGYIPISIGNSIAGRIYLLCDTPTSTMCYQLVWLDLW
jgi:hypothetical protein